MNSRLLFVSFAALNLPSLLLAQVGEPAGPTEPILRRAPARSEWIIYLRQDRQKLFEALQKPGQELGPQEGGDASTVKSRSVSKNGDIYREVTEWGDGQTREKWIEGEKQVYETRVAKKIARAVIADSSQYSSNFSDYRRSDFEDLEWVKKENYRGIKDFNGRKVFEFSIEAAKRGLTPREMSALTDPDGSKSTEQLLKEREGRMAGRPAYTAYLDVQTQLPVYFDDGEIVRIYKFVSNPGNLLVPPPFAEELARWKNQKPLPSMPRP